MKNNPLIPLIVIEGPTASGKSTLAIDLAKELNSEIISADSRQIYRFMNIGTAKPSKKQMNEITHHLVNIINPDEEYSAGKFAQDAAVIIAELSANISKPPISIQGIPIIAGGTGFYIQALIEGLFEAPPVNEDIREELDSFERDKGKGYLHRILENLDPETAKKIHPNDGYRLKRALEVWIATGKGLSSHWTEQQKAEKKYNTFRILIKQDRDILYERINKRMERMIELGLIEEIKSLFDKGYKPTDPGLTSVGYKEFVPFILGNASFFDSLETAKQNSRNYAKRQLTWYRRIDFDLDITVGNNDLKNLTEKIRIYFEGSR